MPDGVLHRGYKSPVSEPRPYAEGGICLAIDARGLDGLDAGTRNPEWLLGEGMNIKSLLVSTPSQT